MANEKKGRISKLFSKIRSSNRWFHKNSDLYQSIVDAANEYTEQMNKTVTEKSVDELSKIEAKLKEATESYLSTRKHPKTVEGRFRYNYVKQVSNLLGATDELRDYKQFNNYKTNSLVEAINKLRNGKVVDITKKEKTVYGAGASKRIRFEYEGKDGFFTPDEKVSKEKIVDAKITKFKKEKPELWEKMGKTNLQDTVYADYIMPEYTNLKIINAYKDMGMDISDFTEEELNDVVNYHRDIAKAATLVETAGLRAKINLKAETKKETIEVIEKDEQGNDIKRLYERKVVDNVLTGMSKRNTATSRMAGMLGMEDKVAKSTNIKIIDNGVEMEGSFMETAKGIDSRSKDGRNKLLSKGELDLTAGSLQRDLNRMQVLDMVCGQVDRHGGNFFYQVSDTPVNGKYQITGLQSIDNDMAFGNINLRMENGKLPKLEELTLIDEEIFTSLNEFTPDKIKFTLGEMLNEDEISAVISRRQEILNKASSGQLRVVGANEWGANTLEATKESPYYIQVKTEMTELAEKAKIANENAFAEYDAAVERVKAYNEKNPSNKQVEPTKPEHYEEYKRDKEVYEYDKKMEEIKKMKTNEPEPRKPEFYDEYKEKQFEEYDKKIEKMVREGTLPKSLNDFPERPYGYSEYKTTQFKAYDEKIEKMTIEGTLPKSLNDFPKRPYGYSEYKTAMRASQHATREPVSLKDDLAPKASNSKIEPKQPEKQAQKQNNGLGMGGK